MYIKALAA